MKNDEMTEFMDINELAAKLRWKVGTVRNRLSKGESMPPYFQAGRRILFPIASFEAWLKEIGLKTTTTATTYQAPTPRSKGRPKKSSQIGHKP